MQHIIFCKVLLPACAPRIQGPDFKDFRYPRGNCKNCRLDVKMILRNDIVNGDADDDILNNDDADHNDHR